MKTKQTIWILLSTCTILSLVGCAGVLGEKPPNKVEQVVFVTLTNYIDQVRELPTGESVTNVVPVYVHTVKPAITEDAKAVGTITNTFFPGVGTLVAALLTGGLGAWARMRSYKKSGIVLAQGIETIREFIRTSVPKGEAYDDVLVKWLKEHQKEKGAIDGVLSLLNKYVSNKDAKLAATEIKGVLDSLGQPPSPPTPPTA